MVPKLERGLCGSFVIVKQAAESPVARDPAFPTDVVDASIDQAIVETLVIPFAGVLPYNLATTRCRGRSPSGTTWPTHSDFSDRTNRSA
jgi:hypothetical protein